jgi:hypothetical protein
MQSTNAPTEAEGLHAQVQSVVGDPQKLKALETRMGVFYGLRGSLGTRAARRKAGLSPANIMTWELVVATYRQQRLAEMAKLPAEQATAIAFPPNSRIPLS